MFGLFVASDVLCGRLHCQGDAGLPVNFVAFRYQSGHWTLGDGTTCRYTVFVPFYSGPDRPDPGLVPDGASCGTDKVGL